MKRRFYYKDFAVRFCVFALVFGFFASLFSGCQNSEDNTVNKSKGKLQVVASLFPQYDFARQILKEKADVSLLLPPGVESHTFDPTPADVAKIYNADIFLYTGKYMEPWAERILRGNSNAKLKVVDVSANIELKKEHHHHAEHDHAFDPHIWLDPTLAIIITENIAKAACEASPNDKDFFQKNAQEYKQKLEALDRDFTQVVSSAKRKCLVFGGRCPLKYFTDRYGLECKSAVDGCVEEAEPSVKKLSELMEYIKENEIPAIYHEEPSATKLARSIADQTGTDLLHFSAVHNVTSEQLNAQIGYLDIMYENLENLKQGLN